MPIEVPEGFLGGFLGGAISGLCVSWLSISISTNNRTNSGNTTNNANNQNSGNTTHSGNTANNDSGNTTINSGTNVGNSTNNRGTNVGNTTNSNDNNLGIRNNNKLILQPTQATEALDQTVARLAKILRLRKDALCDPWKAKGHRLRIERDSLDQFPQFNLDKFFKDDFDKCGHDEKFQRINRDFLENLGAEYLWRKPK